MNDLGSEKMKEIISCGFIRKTINLTIICIHNPLYQFLLDNINYKRVDTYGPNKIKIVFIDPMFFVESKSIIDISLKINGKIYDKITSIKLNYEGDIYYLEIKFLNKKYNFMKISYFKCLADKSITFKQIFNFHYDIYLSENKNLINDEIIEMYKLTFYNLQYSISKDLYNFKEL